MLLSLGVGMAFSLAQGDRENEKPNVFVTAYFLVGLAFELVMAFLIALICYIMEPDWMLMYFTPRDTVPNALVVYIFCGYFAMYLLGFLLVPAMRRVSERLAWAAFAADLALIAVFIGFTFHRLWYVGDFASYNMDNAKAIYQTPVFWLLLIAMPVAVAMLLLLVALLRRKLEQEPEVVSESGEAGEGK